MGFRRYYIDVVEDRQKGALAALFKIFLFLPMLLYWLVVALRNFLYDNDLILKQRTFNIPVISVGNLTWSGTAKTSLAIALSRDLSPKKVAVLSRGYGSDETALLKDSLDRDKAGVFADKDRATILSGISSDYDIAILDDGFQYRRIEPDANILLINGRKPFGNGFLIPLGSLREPKKSLKRADIAVIMHVRDQELHDRLKRINPCLEIFYAHYKAEGLSTLQAEPVSKDVLLDRPLASFCAIGYPEGFLDTLAQLGAQPALTFRYPDHYLLDEKEFRSIENKCLHRGIKDLVITAKDRIRFGFSTQLSIYVLEVSLQIESGDDFLKAVKNRLTKIKT